MHSDERFYLKELADSAYSTKESVRISMSGRVSSFILLISFIVLAEATISASMISAIFGGNRLGFYDLFCLAFIGLTFLFIGCASYQLYRLYRMRLAVILVPGAIDIPFCQEKPMNDKVSKLSDDEIHEYFGRAINEFGSQYEDLDLLYRRWVYQEIHALNSQFSKLEKFTKTIKISARFTVCSVAAILLAGIALILGSL